jgi:hypothetical protein
MFWKKKDNHPGSKGPSPQEILKNQRENLKNKIKEEVENLNKGQGK